MEPTTQKVASLSNWKAAAAVAHARLCTGSHGCSVGEREAWLEALTRITCGVLASAGYARPREIPDAWPEVLREIALYPSTARDGLVQRGSLRVPLRSFARFRGAPA